MTGFGTTASLIGRPDVGLLTGTEMVDNARRIAAAVDVPVIADADTGYGNAINVVRTVQGYEQAGVAGMHLEDQVQPKKCGHMSGKAVIATDEMVGKIRAAVAARRDPDFLLIARTDAAAVEGLDAAIARARALRRGRGRRAVRRGADQRGRHRARGRRAARGGAAGVQLGRGRAHPADPAGPDRRAGLLAGAVPDRHAARRDGGHPGRCSLRTDGARPRRARPSASTVTDLGRGDARAAHLRPGSPT